MTKFPEASRNNVEYYISTQSLLSHSSNSMTEDKLFPLRVDNLDETTTRDDVFSMFRRFGHISRVFVALDAKTQKCRGTAFVSFRYKEDADVAQQAMDRSKHGYLVLSVRHA